MTRFLFLIVFYSFLIFPVQAGTDVSYFSYMPDVPLMTGFEELDDQTLVFDKPAGRIVESFAIAEDAAPEEVLAFYRKTLPQLGWQEESETLFIRNSERLVLNIEETEGHSVLHFVLAPY